MKTGIVCLALSLLPALSHAQVKQPAGEALVFIDVIQATDSTATKDEMYSRALEWSSKAFKSARAVTDIQDREAGIIMIKAKMAVTYDVMAGSLKTEYGSYTVKIAVKPGKIRMETGPFFMAEENLSFPGVYVCAADKTGYKGMGKRVVERTWEAYKEAAYDTHESLLSNLKKTTSQKDSW